MNKHNNLTKTRRKRFNNTPEIKFQLKRIGNDSIKARIGNDLIKTERRRTAYISQAKRLQTTKKGDTRIRKSPDAYLFVSHVDLKPILFINKYNII